MLSVVLRVFVRVKCLAFAVPSVFHTSLPALLSYALKYIDPLKTVKAYGELPLDPELMSFTISTIVAL